MRCNYHYFHKHLPLPFVVFLEPFFVPIITNIFGIAKYAFISYIDL
ncbi:hypothetical protein B4125_2419 [Bacillus paralicheniformis]|nr:hypothetical protein SC10_B2orf04240 [Bacillus paralicheniformis]OLG08238.1 hypothetical protein B4125_2419 [Bacillus paralicheniformis]